MYICCWLTQHLYRPFVFILRLILLKLVLLSTFSRDTRGHRYDTLGPLVTNSRESRDFSNWNWSDVANIHTYLYMKTQQTVLVANFYFFFYFHSSSLYTTRIINLSSRFSKCTNLSNFNKHYIFVIGEKNKKQKLSEQDWKKLINLKGKV